jgi:hypothetical protein
MEDRRRADDRSSLPEVPSGPIVSTSSISVLNDFVSPPAIRQFCNWPRITGQLARSPSEDSPTLRWQ